MNVKEEIYKALDDMGIEYSVAKHDLAMTMDDLREVEKELGATIPKNLFLTPRNKSAYYLCLFSPHTPFRTADISKQIGSSRLSFADAESVSRLLKSHGGAISPLGLIFDPDKKIRLLIDEALLKEKKLGFHPNDNTETLSMSGDDFFSVFLKREGHVPTFVRGSHAAGSTDGE
ncbi:MAG: YbaK/EbsC family protein [Clostridia bacterium]|nr:YbaK/EbsC family protein [Clostridia bacterium]